MIPHKMILIDKLRNGNFIVKSMGCDIEVEVQTNVPSKIHLLITNELKLIGFSETADHVVNHILEKHEYAEIQQLLTSLKTKLYPHNYELPNKLPTHC